MIWLIAPAAWASECPAFVAPTEVGAALDEAERAFIGLSPAGFSEHLDEAFRLLPCVSAAVDPPLAARLHGLTGVRLFTADRSAEVGGAFTSAALADPGWTLSETLVPRGHAMRTLLGRPPSPGHRTIDPPASGELRVDGHTTNDRPDERPVVIQWVNGSQVGFTAYRWPGEPLPDYPRAAPVLLPEVPAPVADRRRPVWAILAASAAAASTSAVLYGLGSAGQARLLDGDLPPHTSLDELEAMRRHTNGFVASSGVAAGLAVAGVVTFVVVR